MTLWAEGFRAMYPNVNIQIEGKGSSTAPPALIEGTAQLGPAGAAIETIRGIGYRLRNAVTNASEGRDPHTVKMCGYP
jgi:hypothetical protein